MNSILFDPKELDPHPVDYTTRRQQYFEHISRMSSEATVKSHKIPLITAYNYKHRQLQDALKQKKVEEYKYLHPDTYSSIFDNAVEHYNNEDLKNHYYQEYILKPKMEEERIRQEQESKAVALYGMVEAKKQDKEMKQERKKVKQEINKMKEEIEQMKRQQQKLKRIEPFEMCKNTKVLSKLSGSLFSIYNIYFQEISDALIDDLLLDEIDYFNKKENQNQNVKEFLKDEEMKQSALQEQEEQVFDQEEQYYSPQKDFRETQELFRNLAERLDTFDGDYE